MKIVTLLENRTISKEYKCRHGLSLYIEISNHKILFDAGPDDSFAKNAIKLGINLEDVDIAVISHGHYDHGGGLETFLKLNNKAKIYIGKGAFNRHYLKVFGIFNYSVSLKKELINNSRLIFVDEMLQIDDELILFADIKGNMLLPKGNDKLFKKYNTGVTAKDDFQHELNLLVNENNKYSLFCGCAHRGIANIISRAEEISGTGLNAVIGGFHLMRMKPSDSIDYLNELSNILNSSRVDKYYTCHCTGEKAYNYLSKSMDNLNELKTGTVIDI